ncbi:MAG: PAS domain-containing sensor histidine kinase [Promethearchaeota archaeon]|jgi:PAS domain S-box-containing protein
MADSLNKNTDHRLIKQKPKESEDYFRQIFNNANDLIAVFNERIEIEFINESVLKKILGYTLEEIKGNKALTLVHPDDFQKAKNNFILAFKNGESFGETRVKCKDGTIRWIESKGKIFKIKKEKKLILISRDITARKNIESKLKDSNIELEKINELKTEFLRRATHELKTPLIAIKGYTDLLIQLCDKHDKSDIEINLHNILNGCNRLEHTIKSIIESSKLKSSNIKLRKSKENLTDLINSCVEEQKELCHSRNHSIELEIKNNILLNIDREQIYEVITNLLRNAIIYTPLNGNINIQTSFENSSVIISIKDNGIGFTKREKSQIFRQFGKINRQDLGLDLAIEGSGLGLFISKRIIEAHDGQIWVESEGRNKGATFSFSLPLKNK